MSGQGPAQAKGLLGLCKAHPGVKPVSKAYWRSLMPDKGSAERVTGTFNEPGFSTKAVDMSTPCSWVSTLLSSWPGARATGQGPMACNGCVADRLISPKTSN